jgi:hypothetical protein
MLFALSLPVTDKGGLLVAGLDDEDYGNQVGKPPGQTSVMTYPEALRLAQQVSLASTLSTTIRGQGTCSAHLRASLFSIREQRAWRTRIQSK